MVKKIIINVGRGNGMGKGKKPIEIEKGGLHRSTDTPMSDKIPKEKMKKARKGGYGKKAKKQAEFVKNVLKGKKGK